MNFRQSTAKGQIRVETMSKSDVPPTHTGAHDRAKRIKRRLAIGVPAAGPDRLSLVLEPKHHLRWLTSQRIICLEMLHNGTLTPTQRPVRSSKRCQNLKKSCQCCFLIGL